MRLSRRRITSVVAVSALALTVTSIIDPAPASAATTTLNVNTPSDTATNAGPCASTSITTAPTSLSLREATCLANNIGGAVTINVPGGTYALDNGELKLGGSGNSVTIAGAGSGVTVLDGGNANRILNIDEEVAGGVSTTISNLTMTNGWDDTQGGGAVFAGSVNTTPPDSLTLNSVTVSNSTAVGTDQPGGGVQMYGGRLTVVNSTFTQNQSNTSGSAIYYESVNGPSTDSASITGSTFTYNAVSNSGSAGTSGGAVAVAGTPSSTYTVSNSRFTNNTASGPSAQPGAGGAIYQPSGSLTVTESTFTGNAIAGSSSKGAAIYSAATATLHYNRIAGNSGVPAVYQSSGSSNATDNWWGCSAGPNNSGCDTVGGAGGTITVNPRLVLAASASPATVVGPNASATVTGSLRVDSAGADVGAANMDAFATLPVSFADPAGDATVTSSPGSHSVALGSGQAAIDYHSGTVSGPNPVNVSFDNATATAAITVNRAPAITSTNSASFITGQSGSFTVTTTGYPASAISSSGTLPTGLSFVDNGNGTATISGTPSGAGGNFPLNLTANNGVSPNATQTLTLAVGQAPSFTSPTTATFRIGTAGSFTVTTSGNPTVSTITESGTLPAGITFTDNGDGTATLAGTPTGSGATYPVTLSATNGISPDASQNLTVQVNQAPAVTTNPDDQTVQPGTSVTFSAAASGVPTPTVRWQVSTDGTTFSNISGATSTSYTHTATAGEDGNEYRAVFLNSAGTATTTAATLRVGTAPAFTSADTSRFRVGVAASFSITTSGVPNAALVRTGAQFPSWLALTDNGDGTGTLTGTPPAGSGGSYTFTLKASNGFSPQASQSFTLFVDQSPVITSANHATFTVGAAGTFAVTTTAGYPTSTSLTKTGTLPSGVSFTDNGDGTATFGGTPAAGTGGSYPITVSATAAGGTAAKTTQSFTLTVRQAPRITSPDHATLSVGAAGSVTVTTAPGNPAATTITKSGTLPAGVTFTDNGDGTATIAGTPNAGSGGIYTLALTASNDIDPDAKQTFTLTVTEPARITSTDHATFGVGTAAAFTVTTAGGEPSAVTLTERGTPPAGVTFTDNGDGTATLGGTPTAFGRFAITLTADNGIAPAATQSFVLTVNAPPTITSADHASFAVGTAGSVTVTTAAGYPTARTIARTGSLPAGVTFTDNGDGTATLAGTPAAGQGGSYPLTLTSSNGIAPNATQAFTLTVTETSAITSADAATFTVGSAGSVTVTTSASYPAARTITETGTLPSGVSFTDNGDGTATLDGTPSAGAHGSYKLTFDVTDANGSASQSFTLTVNGPPAITSADHATFVAGTAGGFTVTTSAGYPATRTITETGTLPSGVSFTDNGDGTATLAGTPAAGQGGSYPLTITTSNDISPDASQAFTLTVKESSAITSADKTAFAVGTAGSFTVTTSDGFPPVRSIVATGTLPSGISFTDNGDGTATLAGTPADGTAGSYAVTITVTNANGSSQQAFTLTVALRTQTITTTSTVPASPAVGGSYTPAATATSGLPVTIALDSDATTNNACSLTDGKVSFDHVGHCRVTYSQAGNGTWAAAQATTDDLDIAAKATTVTVTPQASAVFGQSITVTATVAAGSSTPAGSVQFAVDGHDVGSAVTVSGQGATSPSLVTAGGAALDPGSHPVTATFTPTDPTVYAGQSGSATQVVDKAATSTKVTVSGAMLQVNVTAVSPGAGTPSGDVTFSVAGKTVGTATLADGVATLTYTVPAGAERQVGAAYAGDTRFTASSDSLARRDPKIVATVSSATPRSGYGWYRSPVTVTFRCTTDGAPLTAACPAAVVLGRDGAAQSVTRTVSATDGGMSTVTVRGINIDRSRPSVSVAGVRSGATYYGTVPKAACRAKDALSGVARCAIVLRGGPTGTVTFRASATDRAGNVSTVSGTYRVVATQLRGTSYSKGAWNVTAGKTYTFVVYSATRPRYLDAAVYPRRPGPGGTSFLKAGTGRWTLAVTMSKSMRSHKYWNVGIKIGSTVQVVKIRTR